MRKQVNNFWLPETEEHLVQFLEGGPEFAGGPTYQLHKLQAAIPHIKNFRTAIDVGGHCGLWSRPMAAMFRQVRAFEPVKLHQECFRANMNQFGIENFVLYPCALGDHAGEVSLTTGPSSSGDTFVKAGGEHAASMEMLDSFEFGDIDFIKLDCEGFEYYALLGGEQTIKKWLPTIIVEQKPGKGAQFGLDDHAAVTLLRGWGYKQIANLSGDFIMRH